jgi:hypothetical protein
VTALLLWWSTGQAWACSVCQDPNDPRAEAYFHMTIFMSLFPLAAMGGIAWWLYRRYQLAEDPGVAGSGL